MSRPTPNPNRLALLLEALPFDFNTSSYKPCLVFSSDPGYRISVGPAGCGRRGICYPMVSGVSGYRHQTLVYEMEDGTFQAHTFSGVGCRGMGLLGYEHRQKHTIPKLEFETLWNQARMSQS